mmetsp:Transcript_72179/g.215384  ORF Transcript_72179/g.215384 Transcript_72179/m.215384 type:complete len:97 (+) Transcript_72179:1-291(+)
MAGTARTRPALGEPCIAQEVCRLCGRQAPAEHWGHARCHGCSVVDMLNLQDHPFKPLLLDWPPGMWPDRLVGYWPEKIGRSVFTPQTLGRTDALRQ